MVNHIDFEIHDILYHSKQSILLLTVDFLYYMHVSLSSAEEKYTQMVHELHLTDRYGR